MSTRTQPYSRKETAAYLGISVSTLDSYVRQGKIARYYRFGRPCFKAADVERLSLTPRALDARAQATLDKQMARIGR